MISAKRILEEFASECVSVGSNGRVSAMAHQLVGSEILRIAADIRVLVQQGTDVCNLTVGDFSSDEFRIPKFLELEIVAALKAGETNYPPSDGIAPLKKAVVDFYKRVLRLEYGPESVLISGGSRPAIYAAYRAIVDPGDRVLYPVPSWNNNHYCHLAGATGVPILCDAESNFLPTRKKLEDHIQDARMLVMNSPLNPTGTAFGRDVLEGICELVLEENGRRASGDRPLFILYDQVYWMLTFGSTVHYNPVSLHPELAPFTVFVDGISKPFAATGLRIGWSVGPADIMDRMASLLGHVGAWAPKPGQVAVAKLLNSPEIIEEYHLEMKSGLQTRLDSLFRGIMTLRREGFPIFAIAPMGAIYLSAQFNLIGKHTSDGRTISSNEDIRDFLLRDAGLAIVPFQAFGSQVEDGWFRLSVGAVSVRTIEKMLPRLRDALSNLR